MEVMSTVRNATANSPATGSAKDASRRGSTVSKLIFHTCQERQTSCSLLMCLFGSCVGFVRITMWTYRSEGSCGHEAKKGRGRRGGGGGGGDALSISLADSAEWPLPLNPFSLHLHTATQAVRTSTTTNLLSCILDVWNEQSGGVAMASAKAWVFKVEPRQVKATSMPGTTQLLLHVHCSCGVCAHHADVHVHCLTGILALPINLLLVHVHVHLYSSMFKCAHVSLCLNGPEPIESRPLVHVHVHVHLDSVSTFQCAHVSATSHQQSWGCLSMCMCILTSLISYGLCICIEFAHDLAACTCAAVFQLRKPMFRRHIASSHPMVTSILASPTTALICWLHATVKDCCAMASSAE